MVARIGDLLRCEQLSDEITDDAEHQTAEKNKTCVHLSIVWCGAHGDTCRVVNDPRSATAATRRADGNRDGPPPLGDAAHGGIISLSPTSWKPSYFHQAQQGMTGHRVSFLRAKIGRASCRERV